MIDKILYPAYPTMEISGDSFTVNPFEEFLEWCMHNTYAEGVMSGMMFGEFAKKTYAEMADLLLPAVDGFGVTAEAGDNCVEFKSSDGSPLFVITKERARTYVFDCKNDDDEVYRSCMSLSFVANGSFDYLMTDFNDNNRTDKVYHFTELPGAVETMDIMAAVMVGFCRFDEFMKFHKMRSIHIGTASSYIKCREDDALGAVRCYAVIGYDDISVVVSDKGRNTLTEGRVSYDNIVNDIDLIFERALK